MVDPSWTSRRSMLNWWWNRFLIDWLILSKSLHEKRNGPQCHLQLLIRHTYQPSVSAVLLLHFVYLYICSPKSSTCCYRELLPSPTFLVSTDCEASAMLTAAIVCDMDLINLCGTYNDNTYWNMSYDTNKYTWISSARVILYTAENSCWLM